MSLRCGNVDTEECQHWVMSLRRANTDAEE